MKFPTSSSIRANSDYFDNRAWAQAYFESCHRDPEFRDRWHRATGTWDGKIIVDIGCGPGNLFAALGGKPKALYGVDVSQTALDMARAIGYVSVLADAHHLPFASGIADIVCLNATLHHCDDMETVLAEASRLVGVGGILICDHDPQLSAWNWRGLGMLLFRLRLPVYRIFWRAKREEQDARLASEIHHRPGHGVTRELFEGALIPLGFDLTIYPHNNSAGASVFDGVMGPLGLKYRIGQFLSRIASNTPDGALSLMCVAKR